MLIIDDLPDDVLITIFDFCMDGRCPCVVEALVFDHQLTKREMIEWWQSLVHVCRRWRGLVFELPRRLKLQLFCTPRTPARESLDVWPALPLSIQGDVSEMPVDNVIAVLEHSDRIRRIELNLHSTSQIKKIWTAIQVPFRELDVAAGRST